MIYLVQGTIKKLIINADNGKNDYGGDFCIAPDSCVCDCILKNKKNKLALWQTEENEGNKDDVKNEEKEIVTFINEETKIEFCHKLIQTVCDMYFNKRKGIFFIKEVKESEKINEKETSSIKYVLYRLELLHE